MNYVVAITGGIGSGKTTVSNIFSNLGIKIVDADIISKKILSNNLKILKQINKHFGKSVFNQDLSLNRNKLRKKIFSNTNEKKWINNLLHPIIHYEIKKQLSELAYPYVILVAPLLFENKLEYLAKRILVIDSSPKEQIKRITIRDNITKKEAVTILRNQISRTKRLKKKDDVIKNKNKKIHKLYEKIIILHQKYIKLSKNF